MRIFITRIDGICTMYPCFFSLLDEDAEGNLMVSFDDDDEYNDKFKVALIFWQDKVLLLKEDGLPMNIEATQFSARDITKLRLFLSPKLLEHYKIILGSGFDIGVYREHFYIDIPYSKELPLFDDHGFRKKNTPPVLWRSCFFKS